MLAFDLVITVCDQAQQQCPLFSGGKMEIMHMGFPDPDRATGMDAEILAAFRRVRDSLRTHLGQLLGEKLRGRQ